MPMPQICYGFWNSFLAFCLVKDYLSLVLILRTYTLTYRRQIVVNARCFRIKWEKLPHASNYMLSKAYMLEKGLLPKD